MNVTDFLNVYEKGGLKALNDFLIGLDAAKLVFVLRELEMRGFTYSIFDDHDITGAGIRGVVIDGPSDLNGSQPKSEV